MASYYPPEMFPPSGSVQAAADESDVEANAEVDQLDDDSEADLGNDARGRALGQSLLPIVRLENIIQADGVTGTLTMSKEALFIISIATEEFIKRLAQGGLDQAKSQERSAVQYEDMAATILQYQEFRFLEDYIPTPISLADALAEREVMEAKVFDEEPAAIPKPSNTVPSYAIMNNPSSTSKFRVQPQTNGGTAPKTTKSNGTRSNGGQSAQPQASSSIIDVRPWNHNVTAPVVQTPTYWMGDQPIDSLKHYIAQRFPDIPSDTPTPELFEILTRRGVLPRVDALPAFSGMSTSISSGPHYVYPSVTPTTRNPSTDSLPPPPPPPPPAPKEEVSDQMVDVQATTPSNGHSGVPSRDASAAPPVVDAKMEET